MLDSSCTNKLISWSRMLFLLYYLLYIIILFCLINASHKCSKIQSCRYLLAHDWYLSFYLMLAHQLIFDESGVYIKNLSLTKLTQMMSLY